VYEPNRTKLRHQFLTAVSQDRDYEYDPPHGSKPGAFGHRGGFLESSEKRVLTELFNLGLLETTPNPDWSLGEDVALSDEGSKLLDRWNLKHGEVAL
jgi:hypothetical protein